MSGGVGEESGLLLPTGLEAELGSKGLRGRWGGVGRVRAWLVAPTGQHGSRFWTEAWQNTGAVGASARAQEDRGSQDGGEKGF